MATKVTLKTGVGTATEDRLIQGDPTELSEQVNDALQHGEKFVTFTGGDGKKISLIAERIIEIWEE